MASKVAFLFELCEKKERENLQLQSALTTAEQRLSVAVKLDADDKDGFDWKVLDRIHDLDLQLTTAQERETALLRQIDLMRTLGDMELRLKRDMAQQLELTTAQEENKRYKAALEKAYEASAMFPTGNVVFDKKMMDDVYNAVQSALNGGKNE